MSGFFLEVCVWSDRHSSKACWSLTYVESGILITRLSGTVYEQFAVPDMFACLRYVLSNLHGSKVCWNLTCLGTKLSCYTKLDDIKIMHTLFVKNCLR